MDCSNKFSDVILEQFVVSVLESVSSPAASAASVARVLVDADLRGIDTHGVARLPAYVRLVELGFLDVTATPRVCRKDGAIAIVDAANGFGQPAGELAIDEACTSAEEFGIGWTSVQHSNHFGIVGYYTRLAAKRGFIAFGATNSAAVVAPTRTSGRFLGTNPLAFAVPGPSGIAISLDMSTSAVAGGKLEKATREGKPIPLGWVLTQDGQGTTDPARGIMEGGALLPLGGTEEHSSYKGYGLGLMVEVLTSALLLAPYGPGVGPLTSSAPKGAAEISQFFMVLNPGRFGEHSNFVDHVNNLCSDLRNLRPSDPSAPVLVPGDPEDEMYSRNFVQGIPVHSSVLDSLNELASRVGVPHLGSRDMPFADVEERP